MKTKYAGVCLITITITSLTAHSMQDETVLLETLQPFVASVEKSVESIPASRRVLLDQCAAYVAQRISADKRPHLLFICTHNSRRSHLAQIWAQVAVDYYHLPGVQISSGGTEATACNIRTVRSLRRAGLSVVASTSGDNPKYLVQYSESQPPIEAYSKVFPQQPPADAEFAAMMCCSDADEKCPLVAGADARFALHYEDPKVADNTPQEASRYDERSRQIASEMFYIMHTAAAQLQPVSQQ